MQNIFYKISKDDRGAVIVLTAVLLSVLLGVTAFAIDFGYRQVVRNELQNAADAAALAAARELGMIYKGLSYEDQQSYICDRGDSPGCADVINAALDTAKKNYAGDIDELLITDASSDILIGKWWPASTEYTWMGTSPESRIDNLNRPEAVMVRTRRDGISNGPISTFFASIFNIDSMAVTAIATAALSGEDEAEPGEIELPVGISSYWFENNECRDVIAFSPSNDPASCAGWHTFDSDPANDSRMRDILAHYIETGDSGSPATDSGETSYEFIGGELSKNTFESLMVTFQKNGYDISGYDFDGFGIPITDTDGNPLNDATNTDQEVTLCTSTNTQTAVTRCDAGDSTGTPAYYPDDPTTSDVTEEVARNLHAWRITVPVYEGADCSNPNKSIKIVGFAPMEIQDVGGPSDKTIKGKILCSYVEEDSRGGGGSFGKVGSIPQLVE